MIRVLDDKTINKIAAGEVVERPSAALKELIENALDAGADEIRVDLIDGGKRLIHIRDNGHGMSREDAILCLQRHATSKIESDADLFKIMTLGFRGEAIPSIASISQFELKTRTDKEAVGTHITVEGGNHQGTTDAGTPVGTQITIRNLFYNVPVRKKFLRTDSTELSHCLEAVIRQALIRPWLDVEVNHNNLCSIRSVKTDSLSERAADLLGSAGTGLFPVEFEVMGINVAGLISPVGVHRATGQSNSYLYVNGRFVKDTALRRAIREAYQGLIPKGRHPVIVLKLDVPPDEVDVNVHPAKIEVRFHRVLEICRGITRHIREALQTEGLKRTQPKLGQTTEKVISALPQDYQVNLNYEPVVPHPAVSTQASKQKSPSPLPSFGLKYPELDNEDGRLHEATSMAKGSTIKAPRFPLPVEEVNQGGVVYGGQLVYDQRKPDAFRGIPNWPEYDGSIDGTLENILPVSSYSDLRVIGQLGLTYILCEGGGELVVIDQHAAHERIMLYRLASNPQLEKGDSQTLLIPLTITLTAQRLTALESKLDILATYGIVAEAFGIESVLVRELPQFLQQTDIKLLLEDVADDISNGGNATPIHELLQHKLATRACHNSIRAGDTMSHFQMKNLLEELDEVDFGVCAHGRPVAIFIGPKELEKRFHRA